MRSKGSTFRRKATWYKPCYTNLVGYGPNRSFPKINGEEVHCASGGREQTPTMNLPRLRIPPLDSVELPPLSSVRGRIIAGFGLLIIILIVIVAGSAWLARGHQSALAKLEATAATANLLEDASLNATLANLLLERYVVTGNEEVVPVIGSSMATVRDRLAEAHAQEEARGDSDVAGVDDEEELEELGELAAGAAALSDHL